MSVAYHAVGWNRQKRVYDLVLAGLLGLGFLSYGGTITLLHPDMTAETLIIRFSALTTLLLLHFILAIGPLCRLDRRFLPFLYNRRHLGVTMFGFAFLHGAFSTFQFHAFGNTNPLVSVLSAYASDYTAWWGHPAGLARFPFESLGLGALCIFLLMAATSHDFWLKHLGPSLWKSLHQGVYLAYGLVLAHVLLGAVQSERTPIYPALLGLGFVGLTTLHLLAWRKERSLDAARTEAAQDGFVPALSVAELEENAGRVALVNGERIAFFLKAGRVFAISNVCRHQGGPLGEGRILYDCVTCPWHGYQYRPEDGCSPPPFTEIVPTYRVRLIDQTLHVNPTALPLQTVSEGEAVVASEPVGRVDEFYIGWQDHRPDGLRRWTRLCVGVLALSVVTLLGLVAAVQNPVDVGAYEFGVERMFDGILLDDPIPLLYVTDRWNGARQSFALVGEGKFGPPDVIQGQSGKHVRFKGSLIHRNGQMLIEMNQPGTFEVVKETDTPDPDHWIADLGEGDFKGELVDTKCYFGVMRPATGKVHRGCAIRCLSGGAPPGLLVRAEDGSARVYLLAGLPGQPLKFDVQWAARVMQVHGQLELHNGTPVLRVASIRPRE
jgi:nitrite reductase/ring-hydroxylating ferredoxin subunit/DMSO/TMAO reductase YedYZ heme-binding membrane subunit